MNTISRSLLRETLSNSSSRSNSRVRTPLPDSEENGTLDVNFLTLEELLSKKLESLQAIMYQNEQHETENRDSMVADSQDFRQKNAEAMNRSRIQSGHTSVNEIIHSLQQSRSQVSSQSRELLLAQLYKLVVTKPVPRFNEEFADSHTYITEQTVLSLITQLTGGNYKSPTEFILLYRSCIALLTSDLESFGDLVSGDFLNSIEKFITDTPTSSVNNENKASVITGYCGLLLVLYGDTSAFGVDDKIKWLLELAQGFVTSSLSLKKQLDSGEREYSTLMDEKEDKRLVSDQEMYVQSESNVAIACLHGVGVLLTLLRRGEYLNELLTFVANEVSEVIDNDSIIELSKAATKVFALCYELYEYETPEEDDEEDLEFNYNAPYYEQSVILSVLLRLSNLSSKKIGRKEKKEINSVFREAAKTIEYYTNKEKREEIYKMSPTGVELLASSFVSTLVKLSKSKSININSWFLYFRLLHLKWCFGFGLHDQLVDNVNVRLLLKAPNSRYQDKFGIDAGAELSFHGFGTNAMSDTDRFSRTDKKRANDLKKAREEKVTLELELLALK